jgi:hypothetical protein
MVSYDVTSHCLVYRYQHFWRNQFPLWADSSKMLLHFSGDCNLQGRIWRHQASLKYWYFRLNVVASQKAAVLILTDIYFHRYTSGAAVLSSCDKVADRVEACMKRASGRLQSCAHYWAVVIGNPQPDSAFQKVGLTLKKNPTTDSDKQVCMNQSQPLRTCLGSISVVILNTVHSNWYYFVSSVGKILAITAQKHPYTSNCSAPS